MIRSAALADATAIQSIYNYYIEHTIITFEETLISEKEMGDRIEATITDELPWIVFEDVGQIAGYAYAGKWKARSAYRHSAEVTVYLKHGETGKGIGSQLYLALIAQLREKGYHAIIGGIALPNSASLALHEKLGFQKVAHFKEVGYKFNQWIDVGYWQLKMESRTDTVSYR